MVKTLRLGFCVSNFLLMFSDFLPREKLTHKSWAILQNFQLLNDKLYSSTKRVVNLSKLLFWSISSFDKWSFANCSAFGSSHFFVSFSHVRKSEKILRKFKTQNPSLRNRWKRAGKWQCSPPFFHQENHVITKVAKAY